MTNDFVHIHVHSEYSLLDGLGRVKNLVAEAQRLGQPALALTDHGTMHGAIEFFRACKGGGVKPIIGVEAYQTVWGRPMGSRDAQFDRENRHLLLLARNMDGYRNLLKIASRSQLEGYYYRPRVDHDFLAAHAKGLVATTGCMGAEVPQLLSQGKEDEAYERLGWYVETFGKENFFIELQEHDIPELVEINKVLVPWAKKFDIQLVATNDVHYVREQDAVPHDVLLCVQTSSLITDEKRMRMTDASYFLKSRAQMEDTFRPFLDLPPSAFDSTLQIAEMCAVDLEDDEYHLPDLPIPDGYDYQSYLRFLTEEGLARLYGDRANDSDVQERQERELRIIHEMGFDVYFLIVADLCDYARSRNIWWNVRGSGAGSLVAYCIGITGLDPLKNALIFERFLNPGRVSMPDFDLDYPDDQREEMIRYTVEKYGDSQVAQIVTFGRMKARAAIRDVGRAQALELHEVDRIAKMIPGIPGKPVTIAQVLDKEHENYNPELEAEYKKDKRVRDLLDTSMQLEGVARHSGIHAAAVIVADRELEHYTPLMRGSKSTVTGTIAQFEFPILESIGLLKVDFLGLSTLSVMREAGRLIKERHGIEYNLSNIPFEGEEAAEAFVLLSSGEVSGVFQVESQGMRRVLTEMRPETFEHIIATISLYRPGPLEYIPNFIRRLHGEEEVEYHHPTLEPILDETFGILVYQEQIIQVLSQLAGYTPGDADLVRRAISKKKASEIEYHKNIFIEGCAKNDIPKSAATAIYEDIEFFARYGFNKCLPGDVEVVDAETGRLVRIEDLYTGQAHLSQTVTCETESLQLQSGRVTRVMDNGVKPVYRLTTALGRTIEATANHPFYTFDGWRQLDDVEIGDQVALPRSLPVEGSTEWPEHAVIALGHLLAEGNLCHPHSVYFYSQDSEQVDDYVNAAESFENVTCSIAVHKGTFSVYAKRLNRSVEPGIVTWAKEHSIWGKGAIDKVFPDEVFALTNRQLSLLISRMWEGDGHINSSDRSLFYATSSERLARQMQHLFLRLGIISRLRTVHFPYKDGRIGYQLFVTGNENFIAFNENIGIHFLSADRRKRIQELCLNSDRSLSTKDVVPVGVKTLVREAKEQTGITWRELNAGCGVAQREFYPTGAPGKNGFHRDTVQRLADYFGSDELRRYSESHIYWDKVVSIEYVGEKQTYDLEVPGTHNFVANDILVHNSHAADYAVITVQTAYLKAHYPVDYMAALLLIERDKTEKVINFINECRRMGIDVLPPDINYSGLDFDIQERPPEVESQAHRDPNIGYPFPVPEDSAIRFGMAAIKNVGEGPVDVIIAARNEGGPFTSLEDLCDRVDMRQVNKRALECLIKAGALDRFGKRSQLLAVLDQMVNHSAGIHNARESGQLSMFDLLGAGAAATAMPINLPDIEEAKGKERLQWEKELLGVYTISHPLQQLNIDLKGIVTCQCNELDERYSGKNVMLAGMIGEVRTIITKKGDPMAFVKLEDMAGQCEVVVFPKAYEEFREKLEPDSVVLVKGQAQTRNGQTSLLADSIQTYVEQAIAGGEEPSPYQKSLIDVPPTINGVAHQVKEGVEPYGNGDEIEAIMPTEELDAEAKLAPVKPVQPAATTSGKPPAPSTHGGDINDSLSDDAILPTGEASPFQNDIPDWAAPSPPVEQPAQADEASLAEKPVAEQPIAQETVADGPASVSEPVESSLAETGESDKEEAPVVKNGEMGENGVAVQNGNGRSKSSAKDPQLLTVTFRRTGDIDRDMFRLKELHECIRDPRGRDRFFIRVESKGELVKLAFPEDPCSISERLTGELTKHFRVEVSVEEIGRRTV